ncbi:MAG TPA: NAD-dependent epimerase/dehydratase family protein [Vicinamibacterales bacterium]|nr:NAD-dependent epimerase/dehydratase family protein [Vicinamibacterales bacterium]
MVAGRPQRALVTGGAGFIGSHVVRALLTQDIPVTVIDNLSVGRPERVPAPARLVVGDILDAEAMRDAIQGCDLVLHLAARVAIRSSFEFAAEDGTINYVGTASVLRAAAAAKVRRFVYASTMGVYADSPTSAPLAETHATVPVAPYGISKLAGERLVHLMCERDGMSSAALRLFNTYGSGQQFSPYVGVVTIFVHKTLKGETPEIFGDGEQCRDFVHVEDVASAFVRVAHSDVTGETYNVGSGSAVTVNKVFTCVQQAMQTASKPAYRPAAAGELRNSVADISRAHRVFGYKPVHDFATSLPPVVSEIVRGVA